MMLVFDGGYLAPVSKQLSDTTIQYLASAGSGMSAKIESTEINQTSARLNEWEESLEEREAGLNEREISTRDFSGSGQVDYSTYVLSIILFLLTTLIVMNYTFDFLRVRKLRYESQVS